MQSSLSQRVLSHFLLLCKITSILQKKWQEFTDVQKDPQNHIRICSDHFESKCFRKKYPRPLLVHGTIPTIKLHHKHLAQVNSSFGPSAIHSTFVPQASAASPMSTEKNTSKNISLEVTSPLTKSIFKPMKTFSTENFEENKNEKSDVGVKIAESNKVDKESNTWKKEFQSVRNKLHLKNISEILIIMLLKKNVSPLQLCSPEATKSFISLFIRIRCHWKARFIRRILKKGDTLVVKRTKERESKKK
ncbi:hypothetical protein ACFW04_014614 [Cataglyphis niger]